MKRNIGLFFSVLLLIFSACQTETGKKISSSQQKKQNNSFVVKQQYPFTIDTTLKKVLEKNQNFLKLLQEFQKKSYSKEELIDLVTRNKKLYIQIRQTRRHTIIDTAAVKSRIVLSEIYNNKLGFLLQKESLQFDTIQNTFNTIITSLNQVINQLKIYHNNTDEFRDILQYDSISQARKDSLRLNNMIDKPVILPGTNKKIYKREHPKIDLKSIKKKLPAIEHR